jgi:DNA-binding protein H-NS
VKLPNLTKMTFETLISLRDNVDRIISTRAADERAALEAQLAKLTGYFGGDASPVKRRGRPPKAAKGTARRNALKGKRVAPKYRNPADRSQTWAGRGLQPKWLSGAIKGGKSLEDFAIKGAAASKAKRGPKKRGRPRKAA